MHTRRFMLKLAASAFAASPLLSIPSRVRAQGKSIKRIVFRGTNFTGDISRVSPSEWFLQWAETDNPTRHNAFFKVISQTNSELVLHNSSTDEYFKADLAARKMLVREGSNWVAHSDIVTAE